jgi:hypothetical protein
MSDCYVLRWIQRPTPDGTEAVKATASAIRWDQNLKHLRLDMDNGFTDKAGVALAKPLTFNKTLCNITLSDQHLVPAAVYDAFSAMMRVNTSLVLKLPPFETSGADEMLADSRNQMHIEQRLNRVGRGRRMVLHQATREDWVYSLHEVSSYNVDDSHAFQGSCLYSLLRLNPSISMSSRYALGDDSIYVLAQAIGYRNTTLQKLAFGCNSISSTGVGVLLETIGQSCHITDLDLQRNPIGNEGAGRLARSLGNNALPSHTRLFLSNCHIDDDGFIALVLAREHNTLLLQLDLCDIHRLSERAFGALAESLPEIKVLARVDFSWCRGLLSVMPLLLEGSRKKTSLFRFHVAGCAFYFVPPTTEEKDK